MLLLTATTDKIQVITSAAVTVDVVAAFMDVTAADPPVVKGTTSGRQGTAITTAATTDVVAAPAATTIRNVKTLHIRNKHASSPVDITVQFNQNATLFEIHKTTLKAGEALEYVEGVGWYTLTAVQTTTLLKMLSADDAGGQNIATVQPWFPTAGAVTVAADTTYLIEGFLSIIRSAGVTSHTTSLLFGGTATLTSIQYEAYCQVGETEALLPISRVVSRVATAVVVKAASTTASEAANFDVDGVVRINAAGTFIPQFIYSAIPGGAPTVKANSYFKMTPVGNGSFTAQGTWA